MARDASGQTFAILYDPDCGLCRWCTALLLRWDRTGRLTPVALGSARADALLAELTPAQRMSSWHLVGPGGQRRSGGAALAAVLTLLPGGRLPAAVLAATPGATERAYRFVAEHRRTFSRLIPSSAKTRARARIAAREGASAGLSPGQPEPPG